MAADYHDMKLNLDKTKIISFNFTRNYKFEPQLTLDGEALDVVEETKLLGLTITSDCKWNKNVKNTKAKGNGRLWFLRRLKLLGAKEDTMIEIYKLFCRSVLEYCAPVWSGALTKANTEDIERVQRNALKIIMGASYVNYEECLDQINEQTLKERRDQLCLRFAESCLKNDKFSSWFQKGVNTRSGSYFLEPVSKTNRYRNSAIPHLTRLLNCRK
jgi:predicted component of type VI protein secretion system